MNNNYSDSFIKKVLEDANSIAIVGASPNKERDSHKVMKYLLEKGYEVFPVNPKESGNIILGQYCTCSHGFKASMLLIGGSLFCNF